MNTIRVPRGKSLRSRLISLYACDEALEWVGRRSLQTAWRLCERGDWMLWLAAHVGVDRRLLVRAACDCARLALVHVPAGEDRPRLAIEAAERWCDGLATIEDVRASASAAYAAAAYAYSAYAYSAYAAAESAASAAAAAYAAYAADNARTATHRQCAGLVRARIPYAVISAAMEASHA